MFQLTCPGKTCVKNDVLSGLTVALALVPEAVAFAFVAGVEPLVGLYGAFMMGLITAADRRPPRHDLGCHRGHGGGHGVAGRRATGSSTCSPRWC